MAQFEDIKQKINQGLTDRQIAKAVGKRRSKISEIRKGLFEFTEQKKLPDWIEQVHWDEVIQDIAVADLGRFSKTLNIVFKFYALFI